MNQLLAAAGAFTLALAGVGALRFVWPGIQHIPRTAQLALGFCVGCWLVAVIFFGAFVVSVPFSRPLVLAPILALAAVGLPAVWRGAPWRVPKDPTVWLALLLVLLALALSWLRPVYGYDAVMMWALKAKMMFFARTWPATMFDPFTTAHTEYPPLVPSAQAFVFFWLGDFDDVASRVVFAAFFASGAAILWWWLGEFRVSGRGAWLLWWCAAPLLMEQVKLTYADLPLAVFLLVFFGAVIAWLREPARPDWLWLAGIFGGMAFWVKQDAMIGVGAGLLALIVTRKISWKVVAVVGLIAAPWRVLVWMKHLPNDFALTLSDLPVRTAQVAQALFRETILPGGFAFFWPVVLLTLLFRWRRLRSAETSWLAVSLAAGVMAVFAVYWFSTPDVPALLKTSMERVLLSLFVPGLLLVALLWWDNRAMQLALVVATAGLGLFEAYQHTRSCGELWREFGAKTLGQQHVLAIEPGLRPQIAVALQSHPPGTHMQVLPKRSSWRHRFYYETYPYLIVDNSATNVIELVIE